MPTQSCFVSAIWRACYAVKFFSRFDFFKRVDQHIVLHSLLVELHRPPRDNPVDAEFQGIWVLGHFW